MRGLRRRGGRACGGRAALTRRAPSRRTRCDDALAEGLEKSRRPLRWSSPPAAVASMMFLYTRPAVSCGGVSRSCMTSPRCRLGAGFDRGFYSACLLVGLLARSSTPPTSLRSPLAGLLSTAVGVDSPAAPGKGSLSGSRASSGASGTGGYASSKGGRHGSRRQRARRGDVEPHEQAPRAGAEALRGHRAAAFRAPHGRAHWSDHVHRGCVADASGSATGAMVEPPPPWRWKSPPPFAAEPTAGAEAANRRRAHRRRRIRRRRRHRRRALRRHRRRRR